MHGKTPQLDLKVYVEALLEFSQVSVAMINLASEECHMFQLQFFLLILAFRFMFNDD